MLAHVKAVARPSDLFAFTRNGASRTVRSTMALFGLGSRSQQPNRLGSIQVGTSEYGVARPIGWGQFKAPIKLLDYVDFVSVPQTAGGKGGQVSSYLYYAAVDMLLCAGPIAGFGNVYDSGGGGLLLAITDVWTITSGLTYQVAQGVQAFYYDEGVTHQVSYSVTANDFGSDGSISLSGNQPAPFAKVPIGTSPGPLQYEVGTTGLYSFNAADIGKTVSITYAYTTADTSGSAITPGGDPRAPVLKFNLQVALGAQTQTPWGYMLTSHPDRALGYAGLARLLCASLNLGSGATTPSLSAEVINGRLCAFGNGVADCDPSVVITDMLTEADAGCNWPFLGDLTNYSNFCVANNLFISPFLDSVRKATEIVAEICDLTNAAPVWSGGLLKIVPFGDTTAVGNGRTYTPQTEPVYAIDEDELLCAEGAEAVKLSWKDLADNYNRVQFEYASRNDNYNTALIHEQDEASILANGMLPMKTISAHHFCVQLYAAIAMNMALRRHATPLREYEFTLPWYYQLLEPMDIILLNLTLGALGLKAIRFVSVEEQEDDSIKVVAEDFLWGVAQGVIYPKGVGSGNVPGAPNQPGDTALQCAYVPSVRVTGGDLEMWLALGGGQFWGGCDIFLSLDNVSYQKIGRQYGKARAGSLTAALAANADPDTTGTASVTITGSLNTVTAMQANAFSTLSLLGSELIAYETATLTGSTATTNSYNLTTLLRRGIFSTTIGAHAVGEQFIRLDDSIFKFALDPSLAGKTVWVKLTSFNQYGQAEQLISGVTAIPITLGATGSSNMAVSSSANTGGGSATVSVNLIGGASTASGSATLANGAVIVLPPFSWPAEALTTWYGVNFNPATNAYVLYTDQTLWQADQATMVGIGSTTTPAYSGGGSIYRPSTYSDPGTSTTQDPTFAYDGNLSTSATVSGACPTTWGASGTLGRCIWSGFAPITTASATTLYVKASVAQSAFSGVPATITAHVNGVSTTLLSSSSDEADTTYSVAVPSGTPLNLVSVEGDLDGTAGIPASHAFVSSLLIDEIYIQ
jgi:hypothetical protein